MKGEKPYLTDGKVLVVVRYAKPGRQLERLRRPMAGAMIEPSRVIKLMRAQLRRRQRRLVLESQVYDHGGFLWRAAASICRDVWLDDRRLEVIRRVAPFDRVTQPWCKEPHQRPVVFWHRKRPVALLMPMRTGEWFDPRQGVDRRLPLPDPEPR